jgi:hypothetical protein
VGEFALRFAAPATLVLAVAGAGMSYYNLQTTGSAFRMPYQVHEETYAISPLFLWRQPRPEPEYLHTTLAAYHTGWAMEGHRAQPTIFDSFATKRGVPYFYLTPALAAALLSIPWLVRRPRMRLPMAAVAAVLCASLFVTWLLPHYLAPVGPLMILLAVEGLRILRTWKRSGQASGRLLVTGLVGAHFAAFALAFGLHMNDEPRGWQWNRSRIENALSAMPGKHLVLVQYTKRHNPHQEWVYNAADIDAADVVWARTMGPTENRQLYAYYSDRRIWQLYADEGIPSLVEIHPPKHILAGDRPSESDPPG